GGREARHGTDEHAEHGRSQADPQDVGVENEAEGLDDCIPHRARPQSILVSSPRGSGTRIMTAKNQYITQVAIAATGTATMMRVLNHRNRISSIAKATGMKPIGSETRM